MIQIIYKDGVFLAKGTFSMGIAGVYENKNFEEENIIIDIELEDIIEEMQKENSFEFAPLRPYLKDKGESGTAIAKGLEDYYNQKEIEISKNVKQINDCILYHLFSSLEACCYPFWEIEQAVLPGALDGYDINNLEKEIYHTKERIPTRVFDAFDRKPNNGTIEKPDLEGWLRKQYPMFHFDGLYKSIEQEGMYLNGRFISFQFSDGWGAKLLDCAYDEFDENFTSCDWHNH